MSSANCAQATATSSAATALPLFCGFQKAAHSSLIEKVLINSARWSCCAGIILIWLFSAYALKLHHYRNSWPQMNLDKVWFLKSFNPNLCLEKANICVFFYSGLFVTLSIVSYLKVVGNTYGSWQPSKEASSMPLLTQLMPGLTVTIAVRSQQSAVSAWVQINGTLEKKQSTALETEKTDSKCTRDFHLLAELCL